MSLAKFLILFTTLIGLSLVNPRPAQAVVILPPLIAIATVKLVMLVVGLFSVPSAILGTTLAALQHPKTQKQLLLKASLYTLVGLSLIAVLAWIWFKLR